jgi:hypothetical protein
MSRLFISPLLMLSLLACGDKSDDTGSGSVDDGVGDEVDDTGTALPDYEVDDDGDGYAEVDGDCDFPRALSSGDLDGDGQADVALGMTWGDTYAGVAGDVFVFHGPLSAGSFSQNADTVVTGASTSDYLGAAVAIVEDMNGDGFDELLAGAAGVDTGGSAAGAAYLVHGPVTSGTMDSQASLILTGDSASDFAGNAVARAGDVNDDGAVDLLIGASHRDDAAPTAAVCTWCPAHSRAPRTSRASPTPSSTAPIRPPTWAVGTT